MSAEFDKLAAQTQRCKEAEDSGMARIVELASQIVAVRTDGCKVLCLCEELWNVRAAVVAQVVKVTESTAALEKCSTEVKAVGSTAVPGSAGSGQPLPPYVPFSGAGNPSNPSSGGFGNTSGCPNLSGGHLSGNLDCSGHVSGHSTSGQGSTWSQS